MALPGHLDDGSARSSRIYSLALLDQSAQGLAERWARNRSSLPRGHYILVF